MVPLTAERLAAYSALPSAERTGELWAVNLAALMVACLAALLVGWWVGRKAVH